MWTQFFLWMDDSSDVSPSFGCHLYSMQYRAGIINAKVSCPVFFALCPQFLLDGSADPSLPKPDQILYNLATRKRLTNRKVEGICNSGGDVAPQDVGTNRGISAPTSIGHSLRPSHFAARVGTAMVQSSCRQEDTSCRQLEAH